MKLLKLDARHNDARRIAKALIGSPADNGALLIYADDECYDFVLGSAGYTIIKLPLDTIKFCPFVAMREKVPCFTFMDGVGTIHGLICGIAEDEEGVSPTQFSIFEDGSWFNDFELSEVFIDINLIERGELEGCEIVEIS